MQCESVHSVCVCVCMCVRVFFFLPLLESCRSVIADATLYHPGFALSSCEPMGWLIFILACPYRRNDGAEAWVCLNDWRWQYTELLCVCVCVCLTVMRQVLASTPMLGTARFESSPPHYPMQRIIIIPQIYPYKTCIGLNPKSQGAFEHCENVLQDWNKRFTQPQSLLAPPGRSC